MQIHKIVLNINPLPKDKIKVFTIVHLMWHLMPLFKKKVEKEATDGSRQQRPPEI